MQKEKVVILSDFHPRDFPGASGVALQTGINLCSCYQIEFWSQSSQLHSQSRFMSSVDLIERSIRPLPISENNLVGIVTKLVSKSKIREVTWLLFSFLKTKPSVLWIHNIGNVFPRWVIVLLLPFRHRILLTYHDYSWLTLSLQKLYPSFLSGELTFNPYGEVPFMRAKLNLGIFPILRRIRYFLVLSFGRYISHIVSHTICISPQQSSIYLSNGFRVNSIIPNPFPLCSCAFETNTNEDSINVLFAGRLIGKGLDKLVNLVFSNPKVHLHLAGSQDLLDFASSHLDANRFTYYGKLSSSEMLATVHKMDLVACPSQCMDVYPSIVMEALSHRKPVLLSRTCGNFPLIEAFAPDLVVNPGEELELAKIESGLRQFYSNWHRLSINLPKKENVLRDIRIVLDELVTS